MSEKQPTTNERFTNFADTVSELMGTWWVTATSVVLICLWLASGPFMHFSDTWQLIVNTPTTILELWIGFLLAAATNRVERRHDQLLYEIKARASADLHTTVEDAQTNQATKEDIQVIKADLAALKKALL